MTNLKLESREEALKLSKELFELYYFSLEMDLDIWNMNRFMIEEEDFNIYYNIGIHRVKFVIDINTNNQRAGVNLFFEATVEESTVTFSSFSLGEDGIDIKKEDIDSIIRSYDAINNKL